MNRELPNGWNELTPQRLRCGIGACPGVYRTASGSLVIVGKTLPAEQAHSVLPGRVGSDETAIEIDAAFFEELLRA